jgi:hypothetical protein
MFTTIQFPFIDLRGLFMDNNISLYNRHWERPEGKTIMPFTGPIFRRVQYRGPWDGEEIYCQAKNTFNFCGLQTDNFYPSLKQKWKAEILFRRFQTDGYFLVKYDVGFYDNFEEHALKDGLRLQIHNHVRDYLNCQIKIKVKDKLSDYVNLGNCQTELSAAYAASGFPKHNTNSADLYLDKLEPIILIQLDSDKIDCSTLQSLQVEEPLLEKEKISLYFDKVYFKENGTTRQLKLWIISTQENKRNLPKKIRDYKFYSHPLRYLRINLLRIHCEKGILEKLLTSIDGNFNSLDKEMRDDVIRHLKKKLFYLSTNKKNKLNLEPLLNLAFKLEEDFDNKRLFKQLNSIAYLLDLVKNDRWLTKVDKFRYVQIINKIENVMGDKISIGNLTGNFINKSSLINSLNSVSESDVNGQIKEALMTIADKIESLKDPIASLIFNSFNEELARGSSQQDKGKLKTLWDSLVKSMPELISFAKILVPLFT